MATTGTDRSAFEEVVNAGGTAEDALEAAAALRNQDPAARFEVAALAMHVAAVAPSRLVEIYDALTEGWLGRGPVAAPVAGTSRAVAAPRAFFTALWALVDDPDAGRDPGDITVRTVGLTALLPAEAAGEVAVMAARYPGVEEAAQQGLPGKFHLEDLECCPADSLGGRLHALVVDQGFNLEVLDRDTLGLADLPAPLNYVNLRILQCHDIWHEVAGYQTTGLHEVAISGFQMGQFGHHYSSMFLAMVLTKAAFSQPEEATGFLLDTVLSAYRHGRETRPLLGMSWEAIWDRSIEEIRESYGITPYDSPYPAGLLEELRPR